MLDIEPTANFKLPHIHLAPIRGDHIGILSRHLKSESQITWVREEMCLAVSQKKLFVTDRQTDGDTYIAYTIQAQCCVVKITGVSLGVGFAMADVLILPNIGKAVGFFTAAV